MEKKRRNLFILILAVYLVVPLVFVLLYVKDFVQENVDGVEIDQKMRRIFNSIAVSVNIVFFAIILYQFPKAARTNQLTAYNEYKASLKMQATG